MDQAFAGVCGNYALPLREQGKLCLRKAAA